MIGNLTGQQILLIIIVIIILLWLIYWFMNHSKNKTTNVTNPSNTFNQTKHPNTQQTQIKSYSSQPTNATQITSVIPVGQIHEQIQTPFVLYYFYSPTCGYCKQFWPAWHTVVNKLKDVKGISVKAIDATHPENENLAFYYNISGYPTVILTTPDRDIEYTGNRNSEDLYKFVVSNINDYTQRNEYNMSNIQNNQIYPNY